MPNEHPTVVRIPLLLASTRSWRYPNGTDGRQHEWDLIGTHRAGGIVWVRTEDGNTHYLGTFMHPMAVFVRLQQTVCAMENDGQQAFNLLPRTGAGDTVVRALWDHEYCGLLAGTKVQARLVRQRNGPWAIGLTIESCPPFHRERVIEAPSLLDSVLTTSVHILQVLEEGR